MSSLKSCYKRLTLMDDPVIECNGQLVHTDINGIKLVSDLGCSIKKGTIVIKLTDRKPD